MVLWLCSLPWERPPRCAWPAGEDWAEGTASWAAVLGAVVAGLPAVSPSAEVGLLQSLEMVVTAAPGALVVQAEEMGAAAADEGCDEASVVSLVSKGPGFGGRCLPEHQQGRLEQTAPTISCTWVWRSTLVFQICTNVPQDTLLRQL